MKYPPHTPFAWLPAANKVSETFVQEELFQILLVHVELAQELADSLLALEGALPLGLSRRVV